MAAIFETVTVEWDGETYEVTPTFSLIQKIEKNGISLGSLAYRMQSGDVPLSLVAQVYSEMINFAGVKTTAQDVWKAMYTGEDQTEIIGKAVGVALQAFFPKTESADDLKKTPKKKK